MYISGRERKILEILLDTEQATTIKQIATNLDVSERTIHRDLKNVEDILYDHHLNLSRKTGQGLRISGLETDKQNLQLILKNIKHTDFTPEERQAMMLLTLLESNGPIKLIHLSNELKVTVATISNDLDQVEEMLQRFRLSLERRQGYGVAIKGNEADKRSAISYLFSKHVDEFSFISLLKENIQKQAQNDVQTISNRLLGLIHPEKLQFIEREVGKIRDDLPYDLADNAYIGLVVHLALAMERIQQGDNIQFDPKKLKQMQQSNEYKIAATLIQRLEKVLNISIPDDEIGYITMHLMGARLRINHDYIIEGSNLDIAYQARKLIHYVSSNFNKNPTTYTQLLNDLVAHLKPAIYRLKQQMNIRNPMIDQIKQDYPALFDLVKEGVQETFPDIVFPDEEIGYIVLHFGSALLQTKKEISLRTLVVCSSGIGTAKLLATKLQKQFPEIKQVENKSLFEIAKTNLADYDLIVSTLPLKDIDRDYIIASPMLEQADIHKVEKIVRRKKVNDTVLQKRQQKQQNQSRKTEQIIERIRTIQHYSTATIQLLDNLKITQVDSGHNKEDILRKACETLLQKQVLENDALVLNKLLKREKQGGLGIPDSTLVLYHTRSEAVKCLNFTIYALDHPIEVQGMDEKPMQADRILLMLAPKRANKQALEILSFLSGLLVEDEGILKALQSVDKAAVKQLITEQLNQFMDQKLSE